jgi:hypothetical protein
MLFIVNSELLRSVEQRNTRIACNAVKQEPVKRLVSCTPRSATAACAHAGSTTMQGPLPAEALFNKTTQRLSQKTI